MQETKQYKTNTKTKDKKNTTKETNNENDAVHPQERFEVQQVNKITYGKKGRLDDIVQRALQ